MSEDELANTRQPGERYFTWIKRCAKDEEARRTLALVIQRGIEVLALNVDKNWSEICRSAKAYGILQKAWRKSKR